MEDISNKTVELLKQCASSDPAKATAAQHALALALGEPVRKGVMDGDILGDIYDRIVLAPGAQAMFPLDFLSPGTEDEMVAFSIPKSGKIPTKHLEGDELWVPTFRVGNSIDLDLRYIRDARYDVIGRAAQVLVDGFLARNNEDGWKAILVAAAERQASPVEGPTANSKFSKELISVMDTYNVRNASGNAATSSLTDIYVSPEGMENIRGWTPANIGTPATEIDPVTMREILVNSGTVSLYGKRLHVLKELGASQTVQGFYTSNGGSFDGTNDNLVVGLDLMTRDAFVNPVREELSVFEDETLHRHQKMGWYAWMEHGYAVLDNRRIVVGQFDADGA
jgi:hypothetical protein